MGEAFSLKFDKESYAPLPRFTHIEEQIFKNSQKNRFSTASSVI